MQFENSFDVPLPPAEAWKVLLDVPRIGPCLPVVSHLIPEVHVHLIAAIPNGHIVEYMPWSARLFDAPPMPERGMMKVPRAAGLGLTFSREIEAALK